MKSIMEEASSISKAIENAWNRAGQPQEFSVKILEHPKTSFFGLKTSKSAKIAFFFNEVVQKSREYTPQRQLQRAHSGTHKPAQDNSPRRPQHQTRPDRQDASTHPSQALRRAGRHEPLVPSEVEGSARTEGRHERFERADTSTSSTRTEGRHDQRRLETHQDQAQPRRHEGQQRPHPSSQDRQERAERPQRQHDERRDRRHEDRRDNRDSARPLFNDENRDTWTPDMIQNAQEWVKETLVLMGKPDINVTPHVSHNYLKLSLDNPVNDDARQEETQLKSWASLAMESLREKTNKPLRGLRIVLESNPSRSDFARATPDKAR